jgi:hypothetical protein
MISQERSELISCPAKRDLLHTVCELRAFAITPDISGSLFSPILHLVFAEYQSFFSIISVCPEGFSSTIILSF